MIKTICFLCNRHYEIDSDDYQYRKIKYQKSSAYICKPCSQMLQKEAIKASGINPHDLEPKKEQLQENYDICGWVHKKEETSRRNLK